MKNIVSILTLFISVNSLLSQNISSGGDFKAGEIKDRTFKRLIIE